jgi:hypothetical protein
MRRTLALLLAALLGGGCEEQFKPESEVAGLRVLGLRATPAELAPGETAALSALVVDPTRPGRRNTLLWLGCEPDPLNLGRSVCSDMEALADPARLVPVSEDGTPPQLPPGMSVIGFNSLAAYTAPATLYAGLTPEDPRRRGGTVGQVLLVAIAEELSPLPTREEVEALFERVRRREVPSVVTLFRLRVSEDAQRNHNPVLGELRAGGEALAPEWTLRLAGDGPTPLELTAPDESFETYTQEGPGGVETKTEQLIAAWYTTSGRFEPARVVLRSGTPLVYQPPDGSRFQPFPEQRRGTLWAVVRDVRGGQDWREVPFFLCDARLPAPRVTAVEVLEDTVVVLQGEHLSSVLEVVVGGRVLKQGFHSPVRGTYEALPPALPPGEYEVVVRGKHCRDETLSQRYRVPGPG